MTHFPDFLAQRSNRSQGLARSDAKTRGKMTHFPSVRRNASIFTMDWHGRGTEREVKLHILSNRSAPRFLQWIGLVERLNATERVVK